MATVLALSGFMGSGKSAIGRVVADRLGRRFVDLDAEVETAEGVSIGDLFADRGEAGFREVECRVLREILRRPEVRKDGAVLALGGGTVTWPPSARVLAQAATVILLQAPLADQWARVSGTGRPLAVSPEAFDRLAAERLVTYRCTADVVVETAGLTVFEAADAVVEAVASSRERVACEPGRTSVKWRIDLAAPSRASVVLGGTGSLEALAERSTLVAEAGLRVYVVSDRTVMRFHGTRLKALLGTAVPDGGLFVFDPGETSKNGDTAMRCWEWLSALGVRRDDIVMAFGGGVVGDLAGFVAATYLRGVRLWQVPTSLLAQVDSSVGGKVAINLPRGKNLVGTFYQPELVVADQDLLSTLSAAEYASGLGEVVKYALLAGEDFLVHLETQTALLAARQTDCLSDVVARCVAFKAEVVEQDETDRGRRAVLNLGHTVGHALETVLGYGTLSHGAAVGLGLLAALAVSEVVVGLPRHVRARTEMLLRACGLPVTVPRIEREALVLAMGRDKKMSAEGLGFVCLQGVGRPVWGVPVDVGVIRGSLEAIGG
ncbi:MAG: 3-dehydroquinate synthase [Thermoleophilia bacterium]